MPSDIDCYTEFSIKYLNIDYYYYEAKRVSNLMKQDLEEKERDSPHERTTRQVRTDIGESDQHLSYTNKESLSLCPTYELFAYYFSGGMKVEMSSLNCLCLYSLNRLASYQGCSTKEPSKKVSPFN